MRRGDTAVTTAADASAALAVAAAIAAAIDVGLGIGIVAAGAADTPAWARALVSSEALLPLGAIDVDELDWTCG